MNINRTALLLFIGLLLGCRAETVPETAIPKDPVFDESKVTETEPTTMRDSR